MWIEGKTERESGMWDYHARSVKRNGPEDMIKIIVALVLVIKKCHQILSLVILWRNNRLKMN